MCARNCETTRRSALFSRTGAPMALPLHVLVIFVALPSSMIILCLISLTINAMTSNSSPKVGPPSASAVPDPELGNDARSAKHAPIPASAEELIPPSAMEHPAAPRQQAAMDVNDTSSAEAMVPGNPAEPAAAPHLTPGTKLQPLPGSPAKLDALSAASTSPSLLPRPGALPPLPAAS